MPRKTFNSSLEFYIMPCGGAVDAEVALNKEIIDSQRGIIGYGRVVIPNPSITSRYYIRILSANREELGKTSGVEVKSPKALPIKKNNCYCFARLDLRFNSGVFRFTTTESTSRQTRAGVFVLADVR